VPSDITVARPIDEPLPAVSAEPSDFPRYADSIQGTLDLAVDVEQSIDACPDLLLSPALIYESTDEVIPTELTEMTDAGSLLEEGSAAEIDISNIVKVSTPATGTAYIDAPQEAPPSDFESDGELVQLAPDSLQQPLLEFIRAPSSEPLIGNLSSSMPYIVVGACQAGLWATLWLHMQEALQWLWTQILVPLFSRLRREDLLENPHRQRMYEAIKESQGICYCELMRRLDTTYGLLSFHLQRLEDAALVKSHRVRGRRHLFTSDFEPDNRSLLANGRQKQILGYLKSAREASQADIAEALGISRSTVSYHLRALSLLGLVAERFAFGGTRYMIK
jgi:predicted transcriptional regulator